MYNPSRYLRDVPVSVLPPAPQGNVLYEEGLYNNTPSENIVVPTDNSDEDSTMTKTPEGNMNPVEFFISSDGSTILEHTNRVIYLEVIRHIIILYNT